MSVPVSAPSPALLGVVAGLFAGVLFLLPRLAAAAPFLALPLSLAGLFSAAPLLGVRLSGRVVHAGISVATAFMLISLIESPETALGFMVLFGLWALVGGEILSRRKSVIAAGIAGFALLAIEALLAGFADGTRPIEETLRSPPVQASFDQWAAQASLEPAEAKAAIERVRSGIVALYPSLSVISAATIVTFNIIALGRLIGRRRAPGFPKSELLLLRFPLALVVAFVAAGALLLLPDLQTVAWNGLLVTLFLFLLQGLSVLCFFLTRIFANELMRAIFVAASLLGPWAILLSLLGLFDQWFDFRSRFVSAETPAAP
ncbi:MAG: DUF2232 domain-containing protein [Vicinamibacteria bacterium]